MDILSIFVCFFKLITISIGINIFYDFLSVRIAIQVMSLIVTI